MSKKEIEQVPESLVKNNIPFVIYREPGKNSKIVIQRTPLQSSVELEIDKSGFYAFPFSSREKSKPIYFKPDVFIDFENLSHKHIDIEKLHTPEKISQNLFVVDREEYISDLYKYLDTFDNQGIRKAIYSRIDEADIQESFTISSFFNSLGDKYQKAFVYVMNIPGDGLWMGASPELLLSYRKGSARTVALAGTLKIDGKLSAPEWTRKEIDEHRLVEKYIMSLCDEMDISYQKSSVRTSNTGKVYHLKSDFDLFIAKEKIRKFLIKLHPTPAISGLPQSESLDLIYQVEQHERSYYCGFLGYVESMSEFNLYINLRCMKMVDKNAYLFAGGGITPDSDVDKEWEETNVKMSTLTDILQKDVNHEEVSSISC